MPHKSGCKCLACMSQKKRSHSTRDGHQRSSNRLRTTSISPAAFLAYSQPTSLAIVPPAPGFSTSHPNLYSTGVPYQPHAYIRPLQNFSAQYPMAFPHHVVFQTLHPIRDVNSTSYFKCPFYFCHQTEPPTILKNGKYFHIFCLLTQWKKEHSAQIKKLLEKARNLENFMSLCYLYENACMWSINLYVDQRHEKNYGVINISYSSTFANPNLYVLYNQARESLIEMARVWFSRLTVESSGELGLETSGQESPLNTTVPIYPANTIAFPPSYRQAIEITEEESIRPPSRLPNAYLPSIIDSVTHIESSKYDIPNGCFEIRENNYSDCPICLTHMLRTETDTPILSPCGHIFHLSCLKSCLNQSRRCPKCRQAI